MIYKNANWSMDRTDSQYGKLADCNIRNGDIFVKCNFSRLEPVEILNTFTELVFIQCNLINCILTGSASVENCNIVQISRCSNIHPEWNFLNPCNINCSHVINSYEIIIDDVLIDTIYCYKDTRLK